MVALWTNEDCLTQLSFVLKAYDIKDNELVCCDNLDVKKIFTKYSNIYYDKRKLTTETETGILVGLNGLEAPNNVKKSLKPLYDENIIGYLVADSSGFDNPDNVSSLLIAGRYNGHGFFLRKDNYLEKLPMFAASRYIRYNTSWTERTRVMK